jgi:hypothetical protein
VANIWFGSLPVSEQEKFVLENSAAILRALNGYGDGNDPVTEDDFSYRRTHYGYGKDY